MTDEPAGAALLDAARQALLDEVVPGLSGRPRYVALMVANAIGIAARELQAGPAAAGDPAALSAALRAGQHDGDGAVHAALTEAAARAAGIWKAG